MMRLAVSSITTLAFMAFTAFMVAASDGNTPSTTTSTTTTTMTLYSTLPSSNPDLSAVARKQKHDLEQLKKRQNSKKNGGGVDLNIIYLTLKGQRNFLVTHVKECGSHALEVYDSLQDMNHHIQTEIFKWCAMVATHNTQVVAYMDSSSPIINISALEQVMMSMHQNHKSVAIFDETTQTVHGSYLQLVMNDENRALATKMLHYLTTSEDPEQHARVLQSHVLLIPRTMYQFIQNQKQSHHHWYALQLSCRQGRSATSGGGSTTTAVRDHFTCATGYCCSIQDPNQQATLFLSRHFILPAQMIPQEPQQRKKQHLPNPFYHRSNTGSESGMIGAGTAEMNDVPYISTVSVQDLSTNHGNREDTPNFYQILEKANALPTHEHCTKCLREKSGATCDSCREHCASYCAKLCHTSIPAKPVVQTWTITPPVYATSPHRLIPRIVHQTWFERMDRERYPNMSRLMESFQQSGWEYRFYTDEDIVTFLQIHFPPEVLQAYDALIPGAFKADLFRYCVLLIYGGVYADVDIQLQSALDFAIPDDVGFMVPVDEPGKPVQQQMCVWNGLIASAPSHPFLVKAIETIVNQVRNRYTSVDIDATFCPDPELSLLHAYDTLFTAGPCLLGASINRVLGRPPQTSHVPGEVQNLWDGPQRQLSIDGTSFVLTSGEMSDAAMEHRIPGRTIILQQNKWDMGAHRFTFVEQNIVVAATDLPDSNDRAMNILIDNENADGEEDSKQQQQHEHYSKAHARTGVYGVEHLYYDRNIAHEEIRIEIDATLSIKKQLAAAVLSS